MTQFPLLSINPDVTADTWQMHGLLQRRQTLGEDADVSCRIERSTSGSISPVLICHKCPLFPMAKDKGQRTYEEHAFLMWRPHQIHHRGLSRMSMIFSSSCNRRETIQQYEWKLLRMHHPATWWSLSSSILHRMWALCFGAGVMFNENKTCYSRGIWEH